MIRYLPFAVFAFHWVGAFFQAPALDLIVTNSSLTYHPVPGSVSQSQASNVGVIPARLLAQTLTAVDDDYTTNQNEMLSVASPGVMANDSVLEGVSAVLLDPATHLEVTLNPDGSFTYTPAADFIGVYSFEYHLELDSEISDPALVQITVVDTQPPTVGWISPVSDGEVLVAGFETILLEANGTDNGFLVGIQFYRWDSVLDGYVDIAFIDAAPYQYELYTGGLHPGWNQLFARATDDAGNVSERSWIWIYLVPRLFFPILFR